MIKSILNFCLVLIVINYSILKQQVKEIENKLDEFYIIVENNLDFLIEEDMYVTFDYENIELEINDCFEVYNVSLNKISKTAFDINVDIKVGLLYKKIQERYYLKEGEKYERLN